MLLHFHGSQEKPIKSKALQRWGGAQGTSIVVGRKKSNEEISVFLIGPFTPGYFSIFQGISGNKSCSVPIYGGGKN